MQTSGKYWKGSSPTTNGWESQAALDESMAALLQRKQQVGFIKQYVSSMDSKTCYLHVLVKDVKVTSNVRKALEG